jgi:hypothetical protein
MPPGTGVKTAALAALDPVMSVAATAGPAQSAQRVLFTPNRSFLSLPFDELFPMSAPRAVPIGVHVAGTPCCLAVCSRWASRERRMHTSHVGTTSTVFLAAYVDHDDQPAAGRLPGRTGTGHSLRQDALDPGFHSVPTGPAHTSPDADGAGLS